MPVYHFKNVVYRYISNGTYQYPTGTTTNPIPTGWHYIPNTRFKDFINSNQFATFATKATKFRVTNIGCTVQNMIPLTDQVAIQANATFTAFNNTIYALAYQDDIHSCGKQPSDPEMSHFDITFREGKATVNRMVLPLFDWHRPTSERTYMFFDPLCDGERLMELRPGKNAVKFNYSNVSGWQDVQGYITRHVNDQGEFASADYFSMPDVIETADNKLQLRGPLHSTSKLLAQVANAYLPENDAPNQPNVLQSVMKINNTYPDPIPMWFIKMVPLFDSSNALINTTAQVCLVMEITIETQEGDPRNAACNVPMWFNRDIQAIQSTAANEGDQQADFGFDNFCIGYTGQPVRLGNQEIVTNRPG